ncbi:3-demethylubiquinone-9 3-methyltransferase [compost metagenome]
MLFVNIKHNKLNTMQKITPCLWFNGKVEEALDFYTSIFDSARVKDVTYYGEGSPMPAGSVMTATFDLEGQEFMILNGGPHFTHSEAISFVVHCIDQKEIDFFWESLTADGGQESMCGWVKDKYGISWQIFSIDLREMMLDEDPEKVQRVMQAVWHMKKLDLEKLKEAFHG